MYNNTNNQITLRVKDSPLLQMQGVDIPSTSQGKYLGIILDKRLSLGPHLISKRKTPNNRRHTLRPIIKIQIISSQKINCIVFIQIPIMAYLACNFEVVPNHLKPNY